MRCQCASLLRQKQDNMEGLLAMPLVVLCTSQVCRDGRFKYSIASVTVVQTVHISVAEQVPCHALMKGRTFHLISFRFY